ncbi:MAG: hypothetical protein ACK5Y2_09220 [Bdellovibrionales bacterium]
MMKFICALGTVLGMSLAGAQTWGDRAESYKDMWAGGNDTVRLLLGAHSGANHIGLDYEHRMGVAGVGAYYLQANSSQAVGRDEFATLGIVAPLHLLDRSVFDVYVSPGISVTQIQNAGDFRDVFNTEDETAFGATLKFGMMYYCNKYWSWGLDFVRIHNLNVSETADQVDLVNFAIGYTW